MTKPFVHQDGMETRGDCTNKWKVADSPLNGFSKDYDKSVGGMQVAGDIFTSFFKETSLSDDCQPTCNLFEAEPDREAGLLPLEGSADFEKSGNDLKMKVDNYDGYEVDATVNCDSVGGVLRASKSGRVYRQSVDQNLPGHDLTHNKNTDSEECLKLCEETEGCVSVAYEPGTS